jgi:hypothetical protein
LLYAGKELYCWIGYILGMTQIIHEEFTYLVGGIEDQVRTLRSEIARKSQSFGRTLSLSVLLLLLFYFHLCGSQAGLDAASSNGHRLRIRGKDQDSSGLIDGIDLGSPLSDDWLESSLLGRPLCNSSEETSRHPMGIRPQPVEQWISLFHRIR